jgi:hypothetical protein
MEKQSQQEMIRALQGMFCGHRYSVYAMEQEEKRRLKKLKKLEAKVKAAREASWHKDKEPDEKAA